MATVREVLNEMAKGQPVEPPTSATSRKEKSMKGDKGEGGGGKGRKGKETQQPPVRFNAISDHTCARAEP